ncbi:hypothetical protein T484DRAFT_1852999 [Baffinella frigidus]|nr:hypothetical protein T484DRAFT_1852999 [Cryptophyta sp. CCMP2293]
MRVGQELSLARNKLSTELSLARNKLFTIGPSLSALHRMRTLDLSGNKIIHIPDLLAMTCLERLLLAHNRLTTVPSLEYALALQEIDFQANAVEQMPAMAAVYTALTRLNMANNQLQYLDGHIGGCDHLQFLNASGNKIRVVPSEYGRMNDLETLSLESNEIEDFPAALCKIKDVTRMRGLTHLLLRENNIKLAEVPSTLPDLETLQQVDLQGNPMDMYSPLIQKLSKIKPPKGLRAQA